MPAKKSPKISEEAYQRLAADFANFQRRSEEEKTQLIDFVKSGVVEQLLPVVDNFHRAATHAPEIPLDGDFSQLTEEDFARIRNYFNGLKLIEKQLEDTLASMGLTRIPTAGVVFNPNIHEAISHEDSIEVPADHIIGEVESGWQLNGKIIRPAKVRVSKG